MTEPLSWTWLAQSVLLILVVTSAVAVLLLLWQRRRPLQVHVLKHEVNKSFEELRAEIEQREKAKPQWKLTDAAKERGLGQGHE
jgi:hypothetical protein